MSRHISSRDRRDAITISEIYGDEFVSASDDAGAAIGSSDFAFDLATSAAVAVLGVIDRGDGYLETCHLEAAALLRDGWCPGDPVRRIKRGAK